ncbi:LGFP repeat-containing protein [Embleya sp. AB8]|uniref:LGFP repeat-containing protein n=1 Tax=Embleya sp. AB8 TaxID=3156304 RepID=UPI003C75DC11
MTRTTFRMMAVGAAVAAATVFATPAPMAQATPSSAAACGYSVPQPLWARWNQFGSEGGSFGCPTTGAYNVGNGLYQQFERGTIAWSPSQGTNMVVSAQRWGSGLRFDWGLSDPFNYNDWLINITRDGNNINGDQECIAHGGGSGDCGRYDGTTYWYNLTPGQYRISVEGCDIGFRRPCRQGWTIPVYVGL